MSLHNDPQYIALAKVAAGQMGSSDPDIIAAILAQWTCEKGNNDAYPPGRNNPGNLARGAVPAGFRYFIEKPNPQPGNPIVTFYSANEGAAAYAALIKNGGQVGERYAGVMAAVRAGNGHDYIIEMGQSGYGTTTSCMLTVYHPPAPPTDTGGGAPVLVVTNTAQMLVDIPVGTQLYDEAGKPLVKVSVAQKGLFSPWQVEFGSNFHCREVTVTTGGKLVVAFVHNDPGVVFRPVP